MLEIFVDIIGWVGACCLLLGYWFISIGALQNSHVTYQGLNLLGCVFMTVNAGYYQALPSAALNVIWGSVALTCLILIIFKKAKLEKESE